MFTPAASCVSWLILVARIAQGWQAHVPPRGRFGPHPAASSTAGRRGSARNAEKLGGVSSLASTERSQVPSPSPEAETHPLRLTHHPVLGAVRPIRVPGQEEFVAQLAVPTFACVVGDDHSHHTNDDAASARHGAAREEEELRHDGSTRPMKFRGLEGVVEPGPAFVLDNVLSPEECLGLIEACEALGFGLFREGKNHHGALQLVVSEDLTRRLSRRLSRYVNVRQVDRLRRHVEDMVKTSTGDGGDGPNPIKDETRLEYRGLNRRWRVYRYEPGGVDHFAPHIDAGFPPSGLSADGTELVWDCSGGEEIVSRLTVLFYLNDDFHGGCTNFFEPVGNQPPRSSSDGAASPSLLASVKPVAGSCLVFPQGVGEDAVACARVHWPIHEGSPVKPGSAQSKYVIRSDVLFATVREASSYDDPMFRHDTAVKQAFLPTSAVFNANFQSHIDALYNPHMGVENLGPFLYSFVRFTKVCQVLEIGAGYTTVWILQALRDNHEEMERIHKLQESGQCRLLDWPWTNEEIVNRLVDKQEQSAARPRLLCVDNCEHQKQTASGAAAVAQELGLDSYLQFQLGDAFDLKLEADSLDVVWCDFGVGSRMRDFCSSAWDSIRPGGFLLCHSTLTNERTRAWLEAARRHRGVEATGIPAGDYVEVSLLEPHKFYQNSISIFQKRRGYSEPVYSEFA